MGNIAENMENFGLDIFSTFITMTKFPHFILKILLSLKNNLEKSSREEVGNKSPSPTPKILHFRKLDV